MTTLNPKIATSILAISLIMTSTTAIAQSDQGASGDRPAGSSSAQGQQGLREDTLIATVDGTEIVGSDILTMIGLLPDRMRDQPMQMVVPLALDQLVLRELILEQARADNLAEDPEVTSQVEASTRAAEEDVMVGVWLDRELQKRVTDDMVTQTYDGLVTRSEQAMPPLEDLRPQIEQHLRQQALQEIRASLRDDAQIVVYGPDGRPLEKQSDGPMSQGQSDKGSGASDPNASQ